MAAVVGRFDWADPLPAADIRPKEADRMAGFFHFIFPCYCIQCPDGAVLHSPNTSTSVCVPIYTWPLKIMGVEKVVTGPMSVVTLLLL